MAKSLKNFLKFSTRARCEKILKNVMKFPLKDPVKMVEYNLEFCHEIATKSR